MSESNEVRVTSWVELQEVLYEGAWRPDLQRFRSPFAFRGINSSDHGLETSLSRLGDAYAGLESHLLRNFRKYAHRDSVQHDTIWNWLSLAKHHGLPTRLLDWSFSPLVAMHFATSNIEKFDQDGAVYAVRFVQVHELLPDHLRESLNEQGGDVFTASLLAEVIPNLEDMPGLSEQDYVIFFEPPSIDERIVNQFALFSLMSRAGANLESWLSEHTNLYKKVIVPASLKWEIRDKLDQANITERVLFPGLDGLSLWLARHYSQRRDGPG
jgi:hypothetical protein